MMIDTTEISAATIRSLKYVRIVITN
jgi:hypothetical protein